MRRDLVLIAVLRQRLLCGRVDGLEDFLPLPRVLDQVLEERIVSIGSTGQLCDLLLDGIVAVRGTASAPQRTATEPKLLLLLLLTVA